VRLCVFGYPGCFYRVVGDFTGFGFPEGSWQQLGGDAGVRSGGRKRPVVRFIPHYPSVLGVGG